MTLDDTERKQFEDQIEALNVRMDMLSQNLTRMLGRQDTDRELRERIEFLESKLPVELANGRLPEKSKISRIECQIFHAPDLTPNQRKAKTEWSLRLTVYLNGKRAKPDRNVRLYEGTKFYDQVQKFTPPPLRVYGFARTNRTNTDSLAGMVQALTDGAGSPYMPDQFCILTGHLIDMPQVEIRIGADVIRFDSCRPGKGEKPGHAKWYLDWRSKE